MDFVRCLQAVSHCSQQEDLRPCGDYEGRGCTRLVYAVRSCSFVLDPLLTHQTDCLIVSKEKFLFSILTMFWHILLCLLFDCRKKNVTIPISLYFHILYINLEEMCHYRSGMTI